MPLKPGQPLRLCVVDGRTVAVAPEIGGRRLPAGDAVLVHLSKRSKRNPIAKVQLLGTN